MNIPIIILITNSLLAIIHLIKAIIPYAIAHKDTNANNLTLQCIKEPHLPPGDTFQAI